MLGKTMLLKMFDYSHATNNRLLDRAVSVTPEQWDLRQDYGQRSLHETFFHILAVEEEWQIYCQHQRAAWDERHIQDYPNVDSLRKFSDQSYAVIRAFLETLDEEKLTSKIFGLLPDGTERAVTLWDILTHSLFHSAQHRSEAAFLLTKYGLSPGEIDYYGFKWWE